MGVTSPCYRAHISYNPRLIPLCRRQLVPLPAKLLVCLAMANTKETYNTDSKPLDHATIEDVSLKRDDAAIANAEEHSLSMKDALLNNKRILCWCFFFAMSAIGWCGHQLTSHPSFQTLLTTGDTGDLMRR